VKQKEYKNVHKRFTSAQFFVQYIGVLNFRKRASEGSRFLEMRITDLLARVKSHHRQRNLFPLFISALQTLISKSMWFVNGLNIDTKLYLLSP
jgi:hypothetical protein